MLIFVLSIASELATTGPLSLASKASIAAKQKAVSALRNAEVIHTMGMLGVLRESWLAQHGNVLNLQVVVCASNKVKFIGTRWDCCSAIASDRRTWFQVIWSLSNPSASTHNRLRHKRRQYHQGGAA